MSNELAKLENHLKALRCSVDEIDDQIRSLQDRKAALSSEMMEVEVAFRVIGRLTGLDVSNADLATRETEATTSGDKPHGIPPMPEMITKVLYDYDGALEPKQIAESISKRWWRDVVLNNVASTCWRMWKHGRLEKDEGSSSYRLPNRDEPPDEKLARNESEGSLFETTAKGREAVPGGGP